MDAAFTATAQAGGSASAALPATEPASETTPRSPGLRGPDESMIGMRTRVLWKTGTMGVICLRVHGSAAEYVVSGVGDPNWREGQPVFWKLWPAPTHRDSPLPRWPASALEGWGV